MSDQPTPAPAHPLEDPAQFLALGLQLAEGTTGGLAHALAERALARHGDDPRWQALAGTVLRHDVPDFHVRMLRDGLRNAAYRAAIERFARGRVVLDIGTGSGLLAMMAARAGAAHVYACEASPLLAASARAVIVANGLTGRITLFDRHSTALERVRDLGGGVDLVVSEVFCHTLIGEGVLGSLAHARAELAASGALFLPERASPNAPASKSRLRSSRRSGPISARSRGSTSAPSPGTSTPRATARRTTRRCTCAAPRRGCSPSISTRVHWKRQVPPRPR